MPAGTRKPAPSYDELVTDLQERKSPRIYKQEAAQANDEMISRIVRHGAEELEQIAAGGEIVSLSDLKTVKAKTLLYLQACDEASTIPTMGGLARSLGVTSRALNKHRTTHPDSKTATWLELCHDAFADMMAESALRGTVQPVVAIFTLKARSGWRDTITIEPVRTDPIGESASTEELSDIYFALDDGGSTDE
jgi:hypothetical protein